MKKIYLEGITVDDFKDEIRKVIEEGRNNVKQPDIVVNKKEIYGTRNQISESLHISLPTLWEFTKKGILKGYKISGRVLYKWAEVEKAVTEISPKKWR